MTPIDIILMQPPQKKVCAPLNDFLRIFITKSRLMQALNTETFLITGKV